MRMKIKWYPIKIYFYLNQVKITLNKITKIIYIKALLSKIPWVIKNFVDWCDEINASLSMLTDFVGNIKQQMFY